MAFGLNIGDILLTILADGSHLQRDIEQQGLAAANRAGPAIGASLGASMAQGFVKTGKAMESVGSSLTKNLTVPIVAAGTAITAVGLKFDTTLREIVSLTDVTQEEIGGVRDEILKLAPAVGKSPQELAEAFYFLASGGFNAKESLQILEVSAKAAAAGLGQTQDVAKVVGASINAFGHNNLSAADATDQLIRAIKDGTAEAPDFAGALGDVVGSAAVLGATFADTAGAMAAMTLKGINADEAATSLNQVFRALIKTTPQAKKGFAEVGLTVEGVRKELKEKGLLAVLQTLEDSFRGNDVAAGKAFGNVRALRGVLALIGENAAGTAKILEDVAGGATNLGEAFQETDGPGRKINQSLARIQVVLIDLSEDVLPVVVELFEETASVIEGAARFFKDLPEPVRDATVRILALTAALGPLLLISGKVVKGFGSIFLMFGKVAGKAAEIVGKKVMQRVAAEIAGEAAEKAVATAAAESVSGGLTRAAAASQVLNAAKALGLSGAAAIGAGLAAGIAVLAVAKMVGDQVEAEKGVLAAQVKNAIETQTIDQLKKSAKVIRDQLESQKILGVIPFEIINERSGPNGLDAQLKLLEDKIANAAREMPRDIAVEFRKGERDISDATSEMVSGIVPAIEEEQTFATAAAAAIGRTIPPSVAAGILEEQNKPKDAFATLKDLMKRELTPMQRIGKDIGILTSKTLAKALHDSRPGVRKEAQRTQAVAEQDLAKLISAGGKVGEKASARLAKMLQSKNKSVRASAKRVKNIVAGQFNQTVPAAGTAGANAAHNFISNVRRVFNASGGVVLKVRTSDTTIGGKAIGGPVKAGIPVWINENTPRTELFVPSTAGHVLTHADAMKAVSEQGDGASVVGGGDTINFTVAGALPVRTIRDISTELQRVQRLGKVPRKRLSPMYRRKEVSTP